MKYFTITPTHWWGWFSISFWRNRKAIENVANYFWEKEGKAKFEEKLRRYHLYGESLDASPPDR